MRNLWKKVQYIALFFLAGLFCACHREQEADIPVTPEEISGTGTPVPDVTMTGLPGHTRAPSVTAGPGTLTPLPTEEPSLALTTLPTEELRPTPTPVPTEKPGPTPTAEPEEGRIPIDEAHFTSAVFRETIARNYDTDSDGFLSRREREAVTEIYIDGRDYENQYFVFEEECLDGFEYFPNLLDIDISFTYAGQVVIRDHPSLQLFGGTEGGVRTLRIENCPALEKIGFYIYSLGSISVSDSPRASFGLGDNCRIHRFMTFDADMTLWVLDSRFGEGSTMYRVCEDGSLVYEYSDYGETLSGEVIKPTTKQTPVEFTNRREPQAPFSEEYWTECLEHCEFDELERFNLRVSEPEEVVYNEKGQRAWEVRVGYTRSWNSREQETGEEVFLVYAEEMPVRGQFVFRPALIHMREALEYSPNRGVRLITEWDLALVYRDGEEEQEIGVLREHEHYCTITADGTVKAILSYERWEKPEW